MSSNPSKERTKNIAPTTRLDSTVEPNKVLGEKCEYSDKIFSLNIFFLFVVLFGKAVLPTLSCNNCVDYKHLLYAMQC